MKDLLCTTDLTKASETAIRHALYLGDRLGSRVSLMHVLGKNGRSDDDHALVAKAVEEQLGLIGADRLHLLMPEGDFMEEIISETGRGHHLLVMGTHGPHGLRQSLFGADILKIVRRSAVPSYVVQDQSPAEPELKRIVLPVAGHSDIHRLMDVVCLLAIACDAEVHIYQLMRPGENPSDALLANKLSMMQCLERDKVRHVEATIPATGFSLGFAGPTIEYARSVDADCIAIMSHASEEYRYIADAEKERMLANEAFIPVLCA
ncbi:MAG: universal stress protein [Flavobacteriales bacterium]|nr:universal stress protein [Flavobacteriales bacterium]MCC6939387.1 universal stress protein [Flavobacteriales bacterium]